VKNLCCAFMTCLHVGQITDSELLAMGESLWRADELDRFLSTEFQLDIQSQTTSNSKQDKAKKR